MNEQITRRARTINVKTDTAGGEFGVCPRCGSDLVADAQQVRTSYPSPPLEKYSCSNERCNYRKYSRADALEISTLANHGA